MRDSYFPDTEWSAVRGGAREGRILTGKGSAQAWRPGELEIAGAVCGARRRKRNDRWRECAYLRRTPRGPRDVRWFGRRRRHRDEARSYSRERATEGDARNGVGIYKGGRRRRASS